MTRHPQLPDQQGPTAQPIIINNTTEPPRTNHLLHLILTLLTAGLWLPVWVIVRIARGR